MGFDGIDAGAVVGFLAIALASPWFDGLLLATVLAALLVTLATWRLYGGRPWEVIGWLVFLVAAGLLAIGVGDNPLLLVAFIVTVLVGVGIVIAARFELLRDVWSVEFG